jgi:hypothetical protein
MIIKTDYYGWKSYIQRTLFIQTICIKVWPYNMMVICKLPLNANTNRYIRR